MTTMMEQHAAVPVHVYCTPCPLATWRMPPIDLIVAICCASFSLRGQRRCCPFYLAPITALLRQLAVANGESRVTPYTWELPACPC
uniref:Uncharacterized protein n=1 Tax=Arundo donax TaxID=35708 RepID=A0A0A9DLZ5_ARUDO